MRAGAYGIFEIIAWPSLAWFIVETAIHSVHGAGVAAVTSAGMATLAGGMIVASRWRRRTLGVTLTTAQAVPTPSER